MGAFGAVALSAGVIGLLVGGDGEQPSPVATAAPVTAAPATVPPTTLAPTTLAPTTTVVETTVAPTTAPPEATTTTTAAADQTVEEFFPDYVAAIESGDVDFLFDRLHPAVVEQFDPELCRAFIEREILALGNYQVTGDVTGPAPQDIGGATYEVYSAPVSFDFQGESFEGTASFAVVDGEIRWFTTCR